MSPIKLYGKPSHSGNTHSVNVPPYCLITACTPVLQYSYNYPETASINKV